LGVALLLPGSFLAGQSTVPPAGTITKPATPTAIDRRSQILDARVRVFAKSLNLNDVQAAAVKQILMEREQEMLRLRMDSSMSGSERIGRIRMLQDDTVVRIRALLNDEQKKQYDPLAVRRVQPAKDQRSVEDWLKLTQQQDRKSPASGTATAH
jgi:hypothetical protein